MYSELSQKRELYLRKIKPIDEMVEKIDFQNFVKEFIKANELELVAKGNIVIDSFGYKNGRDKMPSSLYRVRGLLDKLFDELEIALEDYYSGNKLDVMGENFSYCADNVKIDFEFSQKIVDTCIQKEIEKLGLKFNIQNNMQEKLYTISL